jgi:hypothetical protein
LRESATVSKTRSIGTAMLTCPAMCATPPWYWSADRQNCYPSAAQTVGEVGARQGCAQKDGNDQT